MQATGPANAKDVHLYLFDTKSQRLLNSASAVIDWSSRNRTAVDELLAELVDIDWAVALGAASGPDPSAAALTRQWWFWTAMGVGVAAAVVVVVVATSEDAAPAPPTTGSLVLTF